MALDPTQIVIAALMVLVPGIGSWIGVRVGLATITVSLAALSEAVATINRGDRHIDGLVEQRLISLERRVAAQEEIHRYREPTQE